MAYWAKYSASRRRILKGAAMGGIGAGALALVGCSDDEDSTGGAPELVNGQSGLITQVTDETAQTKKGGVYKSSVGADVTSLDPLTAVSVPGGYVPNSSYVGLLRRKEAKFKPSGIAEVEGDLAESWEVSADGMSVVFKLRGNAGWDQREPTNSRKVDAEDVIFSWKKYAASSRERAALVNSVNPDASVTSVEAIDSRTVKFNLAFPDGDFLSQMAGSGPLQVQPREAESSFDARQQVRGSGPWMLTDYQPSSRFELTRNPNYWMSDRPWPEKVELPIISEYAQGLAQLKAGNLFNYGVRQTDIVQTKKDVMDLNMYYSDDVSTSNSFMPFGWLPPSPFGDVRVRRAVSMAIDDEAFAATFFDVDKLRGEGLPVNLFHNAPGTTAAHTGWWLDPKDSSFGPNAQYLAYDPQQAKQLLAAAGFPSGLEVPARYFTTSQYGSAFPRYIEVILGMLADVGIRSKSEVMDYQTEWLPQVFDNRGRWSGISFSVRANNNCLQEYSFMYLRTGIRYYGFDVAGRDPENGDPKLEDMVKAQRRVFDYEDRQEQVFDIQRYLAGQLYYPMFAKSWATGFSLSWPVVRNVGVIRGRNFPAPILMDVWLDPTKKPVGPS